MADEYYTPQKIMTIIKYYPINVRSLKEIERDRQSIGIAQYGVEASMPHSSGISNVVEKEALRHIEDIKFWADIITDIKYIQNRWSRITDEREARILSLRLDGMSVSDIAKREGTDRRNVYRNLCDICEKLSTAPCHK